MFAATVCALERQPECRMDVSSVLQVNDLIELLCSINYSGSWMPSFQCFEDTQSGQSDALMPDSECYT